MISLMPETHIAKRYQAAVNSIVMITLCSIEIFWFSYINLSYASFEASMADKYHHIILIIIMIIPIVNHIDS